MSASEGLAFLYNEDDAPWLFGEQPPGTTGLARRLDPERALYRHAVGL